MESNVAEVGAHGSVVGRALAHGRVRVDELETVRRGDAKVRNEKDLGLEQGADRQGRIVVLVNPGTAEDIHLLAAVAEAGPEHEMHPIPAPEKNRNAYVEVEMGEILPAVFIRAEPEPGVEGHLRACEPPPDPQRSVDAMKSKGTGAVRGDGVRGGLRGVLSPRAAGVQRQARSGYGNQSKEALHGLPPCVGSHRPSGS